MTTFLLLLKYFFWSVLCTLLQVVFLSVTKLLLEYNFRVLFTSLYIYHSTQFKELKILNQGVQEIKFLSICHTLIQSKIVKFDVVSFCYEL